MLITPISSPITMIVPNNVSTIQPDLMANEDNILDLPVTPPAPSRQEDWHVPMAAPRTPTIAHIHAVEGAAITKAGDLLDSKTKNWSGWAQSMVLLFKLFGIQEYVLGEVTYPDPKDDPESAANWTYNDTFAQLLITSNISVKERVHTNGCTSAHCMWLSLQSMHESKSHLILTTHLHTLMNTIAAEDNNITKHLTKLKLSWDQLSLFSDDNYHVSKFLFKHIIALSLPESWDNFTDQFVAGQLDLVDTDPRKHIDMQQFIGIIKQEHKRRQSRKPAASKLPEQALLSLGRDTSRLPLASRISSNANSQNRASSLQMCCRICNCDNHAISKCLYKGKPKCTLCGNFGHSNSDCWDADPSKRPQGNGGRRNRYRPTKRARQEANNANNSEQANDAEIQEHVAFNIEHAETDDGEETAAIVADESNVVEEPMVLIADNDKSGIVDDDTYDGEYYNFNHVPSSDEMDIRLIYYDWLADSAATTHITHQHNAFITYEIIPEVPISGVGGLKTHAIGQGRVNLQSECDGKTYILELHNVLHVPDNRNNLLSLGRWETAGRSYTAHNGILSLLTKEGKPIARGTKVRNNLYKMTFKHVPETAHSNCAFNTTSSSQTWETWHRCFGHVGYSGIKKLLDSQLIDGLKIDTNSPKPDCIC